MNVSPIQPYLEPLRKTVTVAIPVDRAFTMFTAEIGRWWPLATHSVGLARARTCLMEPRVGGALYEVLDDMTRCTWGTLLVWEPPHRLVMTWHPGRGADSAQELEVRFVPDGDGTRVELEHRGWQRLGPAAADMRDRYVPGWDSVLARFVNECGR